MIRCVVKILFGMFCCLCLAQTAYAKRLDLLSLYELAWENDPDIQIARQTFYAALEARPQARALFLPTLSATASTTGARSTNPLTGRYNVNGYSLDLSQSLVDFKDYATYEKASASIKQASASFNAAKQDLILRVSEQYFRVLSASDDLHLVKTQRIAFNRHYAQTNDRYQAGLIAITDVHEAKSRLDNAKAQEIEASNTLVDQKEDLHKIVYAEVIKIQPLREKIPLLKPNPRDPEEWVLIGVERNPTVNAARHAVDTTRYEIKTKQAAHLPELNLVGNMSRTDQIPPSIGRFTTSSIGLQLEIPILAGGRVLSETREAAYLHNVAKEELEKEYRNAQNEIRKAYRGVLTQISRVKALKQSVFSSKSALTATESAFKAGTRTIVDVLNAQTEVTNSEKNYRRARYNYVLETLRLKKAAGILTPNDLHHLNTWFKS